MGEKIIQVMAGTVGALGFSLLFNIRGKKLFPAAFGGFLSWSIFVIFEPLFASEAVRYVIATAALTFYAEIMARKAKCPATVFQVSGAIPLIPGGSLYNTINYAMVGQWDKFFNKAVDTFLLMVAIAVGILSAMTFLNITRYFKERLVKLYSK
ncbi:MAG: threonine/serine exporter family protein [Oscillospiraceae bacterium]